MLEFLTKLLGKLPPLGRSTRPNLAAAVGFLVGGIGLAIYFRSFIDFVIPIALAIATVVAYEKAGAFGWLLGAVIASGYGYFRSLSSNQAIAAVPAPAVEADRPAPTT